MNSAILAQSMADSQEEPLPFDETDPLEWILSPMTPEHFFSVN
jgi:hypothetical protein